MGANTSLTESKFKLIPGNGVTELMAAYAFNGIANCVGPFSFTHSLVTQLHRMARMPSFTIGYLYNIIFK